MGAMKPMTRTFTPGQQIRTRGGNAITVVADCGDSVVVFLSSKIHTRIGRAETFAIEKSSILDDTPKAVPGQLYRDNEKQTCCGLRDETLWSPRHGIVNFNPSIHKEIK